ncbi:MAG: hypothetical protein CBB71_15010 [Rhodopirellula sp. TMED11]|nr:MAG: hypothetical protein CBB71_15010 [Rhodopirellula sp. TMED11]
MELFTVIKLTDCVHLEATIRLMFKSRDQGQEDETGYENIGYQRTIVRGNNQRGVMESLI